MFSIKVDDVKTKVPQQWIIVYLRELSSRASMILTLPTHSLAPQTFATDQTIVQRYFRVQVIRLWQSAHLRTAVNAVVAISCEETTSAAVSCRRTSHRAHSRYLTLKPIFSTLDEWCVDALLRNSIINKLIINNQSTSDYRTVRFFFLVSRTYIVGVHVVLVSLSMLTVIMHLIAQHDVSV